MLPAPHHLGGRLIIGAVLCLVPAVAAGQNAPAPAGLTPELMAVRTSLDRYQDPIAAVHDGYLSTLGCVEYPRGATEGSMQYVAGGMGVHFLNLQAVSAELDPDRPQVLIYEPVGGRLRLVAAEWFIPAQMVSGTPPSIFGQQLQGPMEGHQPIMPEGLHHYDLHVWLWKANPAGTFSPTNPSLRCEPGPYTFQEGAPRMVGHGH